MRRGAVRRLNTRVCICAAASLVAVVLVLPRGGDEGPVRSDAPSPAPAPDTEPPAVPPSPAPPSSSCTDDLSVFRPHPPHGGYNNQREAVVNMLLLAATWNLSGVVLPTSRPSDYAGKTSDPSKWPEPWRGLAPKTDVFFGGLWDEQHFIDTVSAPPLSLCVVPAAKLAGYPQHVVQGLTDLLAPGRQDRALRKSADTYRRIHGQTTAELKGLCCGGSSSTKPLVVAMPKPLKACKPGQPCPPRTLCTVVYSRFRSHCDEFGEDRCRAALTALRAAPAVRRMASEVVSGVESRASGNWVSLHLRQWMCTVTPAQIAWLTEVLSPHSGGTLYICSDMPPEHPLLAPLAKLFRGGLVGKAAFLEEERRGVLPFEVRAAVDWEVLLAAPDHFAFDSDSSFTHFVDAYRRMEGRNGVSLLRRPAHLQPSAGCWGT
eukprot:TRINITY_DN36028_c0_g1_i1.p1 TRINITY_DN36028_c0_g1~~TRINITY_DN36028_c0_g1_i1.p1  ORF type:complete len:431 (+),score=106.93 TRINITY_DN36028_c0_g1_i1:57-1349(+)